jgi:hypothetical protein
VSSKKLKVVMKLDCNKDLSFNLYVKPRAILPNDNHLFHFLAQAVGTVLYGGKAEIRNRRAAEHSRWGEGKGSPSSFDHFLRRTD